jgi:tetratricopeptide (TPR) repeat protein
MTTHRIETAVLILFLTLGGAVCGPSIAADEYQESARLYKDGRRAEALERINAFIAQHPKDARARFLKGVILAEQNRNSEAIAVFNELTEDYPELPEPYNNLAVLYAGQGDYEKARKALEMAIRTHPSYAVAHENLGDIYATLASQAYDKALQLDSGNTTARKKLALIKELVPAAALAKPDSDKAIKPLEPPKPQPKPAADAQKQASKPPPADKPATAEKSAAADKGAPAPAAGAEQTESVLKMLNAWTTAWSSNDADGYLAFYAPDFQTPNGEPRADWEANRRDRLAKPKKIRVTASSPRVVFADNIHATVTFRQNYSSPTLKTSGNKTLHLVRSADSWLIQQETIDK